MPHKRFHRSQDQRRLCLSLRGILAIRRTGFLILLALSGAARADGDFVVVQAETATRQFEAYAQVEPLALLPVRAAHSGLVGAVDVIPGDRVRSGQKLAALVGPDVQALLAQADAGVASAKTRLRAAQKVLAIQRQQLSSRLVTQQDILHSEGIVAQAQADFDTAQAQQRALRQSLSLESPVDGTVLAIEAAEGERVNAGDTLVTLQPAGKLWLRAQYYGNDAAGIKPGMTGRFMAADGAESIPVKVASVVSGINPDGGESVGLLAALPSPAWLSGEFGVVTLDGAARSLVAVPTRSLILDQGKWWVLVHTKDGGRRRLVVPGPAHGWQTFIEHGLKPGEEVVVENAYLEFHRDISERYRPPD